MKLVVILASVREGRACEAIANWFLDHARQHGKFEIDVADLKELNLPILNEPHHPRLKKYQHDSTKRWSAIVDAADAFVFVTPEYNYTTPPALVNALDTVYWEWAYKPVAFVSYGGVSAGTRGLQSTRLMVCAFKMVPMTEAVNLPFFTQMMENGVFKGNETADKAVAPMLNELLRWANALKPLRTA